MLKKLIVLFLLVTSFCAFSQEWKQKETTNTSFKIKNFGVNVDGDFSDVTIQTNFNSEQLSKGFINASIVVKSISTGIESRDKHILEEGYFDEPNHKTIQLKSSKIEKKSESNYLLTASLNIKGKSKKIIIPLEVIETNSSISIKANFSINRKDFSIGGGSFIMSKTVKIQVAYFGTK